MAKIQDLPLTELYNRKITKSVETAIQNKDDFSVINKKYCDTVCKLKCKNYNNVRLLPSEHIDILIIQDHEAPKGKYDRRQTDSEKVQVNILDYICNLAGYGGLTYRLVSLLKCAPTEEDFPNGKSPSVSVMSKCKPYLFSEIKRTTPTMIISLSTAVTKALGFTKYSNTGNRGEVVGGNVLITLHPRILTMIRQNASGKFWSSDYFEVVRNDFEKAAKIVRGQLSLKDLLTSVEAQRKNVKVCRTLDEVRGVVEHILTIDDSYLTSCDTETTSLDPLSDNAALLTIQFGWLDSDKVYRAAVIPLWHRENTMYNPLAAWRLVIPLLVNNSVKLLFHNGKFDVTYIYHTTGLRVTNFELDTMLLKHLLDSGITGCYGLKASMWDQCLDLGIGGYEGLLPGLTKPKKLPAVGTDATSEEDQVSTTESDNETDVELSEED